jgi:hypothetical protein
LLLQEAVATQKPTEASEPEPTTPEPPAAPVGGIPKKTLIWVAVITIAVWAFAINTGSTVLMIVVGALTLLLIGVLLWAFRVIRKQRGVIGFLQGATASPEARRDALAKLSDSKDAKSPTNLFARAQLLASDDPKAALALLEPIELKTFHAAMQDDVSLLKTQLYLNLGRTADARKSADTINLENPARKDIRPLAASIVAEAWARTGKPKEALAILDSIEAPKKDAEQIMLQARIARIFARFAANQRSAAKTELTALADADLNHLGRFILPQFRVHPELVKLARRVLESHPSARRQAKAQAPKR